MESSDKVEESSGGALSNTIVPSVFETGKESSNDRLDIGKEGSLDGGEDFADRVGSAFLLDRESSRSGEHGFIVFILPVVDILKVLILVSTVVNTSCEIFRIRSRCNTKVSAQSALARGE